MISSSWFFDSVFSRFVSLEDDEGPGLARRGPLPHVGIGRLCMEVIMIGCVEELC